MIRINALGGNTKTRSRGLETFPVSELLRKWRLGRADKRYKQGATTMGGRTMSQSASYVNLRVAVGRARGGFETRISGGRRIQGTSRLAQTHGSHLCCYGDVQNESIWRVKSETAGATGGAREGRPRQSRILPVVSGECIAAIIFIRPPQRSH